MSLWLKTRPSDLADDEFDDEGYSGGSVMCPDPNPRLRKRRRMLDGRQKVHKKSPFSKEVLAAQLQFSSLRGSSLAGKSIPKKAPAALKTPLMSHTAVLNDSSLLEKHFAGVDGQKQDVPDPNLLADADLMKDDLDTGEFSAFRVSSCSLAEMHEGDFSLIFN